MVKIIFKFKHGDKAYDCEKSFDCDEKEALRRFWHNILADGHSRIEYKERYEIVNVEKIMRLTAYYTPPSSANIYYTTTTASSYTGTYYIPPSYPSTYYSTTTAPSCTWN